MAFRGIRTGKVSTVLVLTIVALLLILLADSPGVPPSANAHHLFRGFSFIASNLMQEPAQQELHKITVHPIVQVRRGIQWTEKLVRVIIAICPIFVELVLVKAFILSLLHSFSFFKNPGFELYLDYSDP